MEFAVISYLLFTILLIGVIALYINKPNLFKLVYFQWSRPTKWLFALCCGFSPVLFLGETWLLIGVVLTLMLGVILEKQKRFALIRLRT